MKKTSLVIAALLGASLVASTANAAGHFHGGGGFHHGGFHGHSRVGVFVGVGPLFSPYYYPPYYPPAYYYPPTVVVPGPAVAAAPAYIEQPGPVDLPPAAAPGGPGSGAFWYYCRDTQTYYPYVQQCASPWERVAPSGAPPA